MVGEKKNGKIEKGKRRPHSLIIYTISGNRIVSGPKSFVSYQILLQIDPINPLGLVSG